MLEISTFHSSVELDVAGVLLSSGIAQDLSGEKGGGGILRLISKDTTSNVESVCFDLKKCFDLSNLPFFHFLIDTHSFTPVHKKLFKRCTNN